MNQVLQEAEEAPQLEFVTFKGAERPRKTFFYERIEHKNYSGYIDDPEDTSETIVAFSEQEAASLTPEKWRQVGVSDGRAYAQTILDSGVSKGTKITLQRAREILKKAFDAELEVARGHFERPVVQTYHFMGASPGTQGYEDLINRKN